MNDLSSEKLISIIFIGDIVGEPGIEALKKYLPDIKSQYKPDFIIANGENSSGGRGISDKEAKQIFDCGVTVITTGNHVWENWKAKSLLATNQQVLRPFNYPSGNPGRGYCIVSNNGFTIGVMNMKGRTFMQAIDCPFRAVDYILSGIIEKTKNIVVDFHADATAEKITMANYLDGRVSAVFGTHTHVQTADSQIMNGGTAFISDAGMTGSFDSVVGMKKEIALKRFTLQTPYKYELATDDLRINFVHVLVDNTSGKTVKIEARCEPDYIKTAIINNVNESDEKI